MSRFSPCRSLTLEGVCRDCACDCAMRSHSLMRVSGGAPAAGECFDIYDQGPPVIGTNILRDPGFEIQPTYYPAGPNNTYLPYVNQSNNTIVWIDFSSPGMHPAGWIHPPAAGGSTTYFGRITNTSPRSGTYHYSITNGGGTNIITASMTPFSTSGGYDCNGINTVGSGFPLTSTSPAPGTLITFKAYAKVSAGGSCTIQARMGWIRESPGYIGSFTTYNSIPITNTSYAEFTLLNLITPSDLPAGSPSDFFRIEWRLSSVTPGTTVDMDDFSLVLT